MELYSYLNHAHAFGLDRDIVSKKWSKKLQSNYLSHSIESEMRYQDFNFQFPTMDTLLDETLTYDEEGMWIWQKWDFL